MYRIAARTYKVSFKTTEWNHLIKYLCHEVKFRVFVIHNDYMQVHTWFDVKSIITAGCAHTIRTSPHCIHLLLPLSLLHPASWFMTPHFSLGFRGYHWWQGVCICGGVREGNVEAYFEYSPALDWELDKIMWRHNTYTHIYKDVYAHTYIHV